ncbi:MAG: PEP-CTERM sorting domain-containing protein [bacterium]|nr:PEP-CTERM sorting domain-containing protein [bacterium]
MKKIFFVICIFILGNLNTAKAISITQTTHWDLLNVDVAVTYPDKVTYGDPFGISFFIDSTPLSPYDMMAFIPNIWISNTVDISNVTWSENLVSPGDAYFNYDSIGNLGDISSQYTAINEGYNIRLLDPYSLSWPGSSGYTWLVRSYQSQVTWALNNFIIQGNTNFNVSLDADIWSGETPDYPFTVFDPPPSIPINSAVPEPATLSLLSSLACGIFCLKKRKYF